MLEERLVYFRPRTIFVVLGIIVAGYLLLQIVQAAQGILIWIFVAIFLALALNPAVDALQRRGIQRRGLAVTIVFVGCDPRDSGSRGHRRPDDRLAGERLHRRGTGVR